MLVVSCMRHKPWESTAADDLALLSILILHECFCNGLGDLLANARQHLLNPEHLVMLSAGPIPHNSIHLLIITTDFVTLY